MDYYPIRRTKKEKEERRKKLLDVLFTPKFDFSTYHSDFINKHNLEVIRCVSLYNSSIKSEIFLAIVKNKKTNLQGVFSYSESKNKLIIPIEFDDIEFNYHSGFIVKKNNLCGLYSCFGECILPVEFDNISLFGELAIVEKNNLKGLYSLLLLDFILPVEFGDISIFKELVIVEKNSLKGVYSLSLSKFIVSIKYNLIKILSDYIVAITIDVRINHKFYYDFYGNFIKSEIEQKQEHYDKSDIIEGTVMGWW